MYAFLQLSFLQLFVFPALISGNAEIDQEESAFFYQNEEETESDLYRMFFSPALRSSQKKPRGNFFIYTPPSDEVLGPVTAKSKIQIPANVKENFQSHCLSNMIGHHYEVQMTIADDVEAKKRENPGGVEFFFGIKSPYFKNYTPTKIITHGYSDQKERVLEIVKEYLNSEEEFNILTYLWEFNSGLPYKVAARLSDYVGKEFIGSNIPKLYKNYEIKPENIHLIGYNIGAQMFGAAGRVQKSKIGRITGLDPARLCFEVPCRNTKLISLSKNDAKFVDIIHTNAKGNGVFEPLGTVDFYPNGGIFQPQCSHNSEPKSCSSALSYVYFMESIRKGENTWARKCSSFEKFLKKECEKNPVVLFGEFVNLTAEGSYFFQTENKNT